MATPPNGLSIFCLKNYSAIGVCTLKIIFAGDISFDWLPQPGLFKRLLSFKSKLHYQTDIISSGLSSLFESADLVCANLECALTNRGEPLAGKRFTMRAEPHYLEALKKLNISLVCLANNHILDYGPDGLDDTIKYLDSADIDFCGLQNRNDNTYAPYIFDDGTNRLAIFNYVDPGIIDPEPKIFFQFDKHPAPFEPEKIIEDIKRYANDYAVIIVPHWGEEWSFRESGYQQELAHKFIDSGACAVIGHHNHLAGSVEEYKNGLIAYNLGNLYMMLPGFSSLRARRRLAVEFDINKNKLHGFKLIPLTSNADSTPVPDTDIIPESYYINYRPEEFPEAETTIFDSYDEIKKAEVNLISSGQTFKARWRDKFYNEPKVIQGKLPLAPGWQIDNKFWCGIVQSREFIDNRYTTGNVTHLSDDSEIICKFPIDKPINNLYIFAAYPAWFHPKEEFYCPTAVCTLNGEHVMDFGQFGEKVKSLETNVSVRGKEKDRNNLEITFRGKKDKFSYICWRILAT
jgi:hypothetical protein